MSDQRIIITGYLGFIGSHTVKELEKRGSEVIGYDLKEGNDVCDTEKLKNFIQKGDRILHLAAVARFTDADANPAEAYRTNVGGTASVLQAAAEKGAERVVYSSTGSVLMPLWVNPIRENNVELQGNSHYGFSKAAAEKLFWLPQYTTPYVILRYGHLYGEGKVGHGAVNAFLERMQRGLKPVIFGGAQSNEFCYIKDIVQANILAIETENVNEVYNIGYGKDYTIQQVYEIMNKVLVETGKIKEPIEAEYGPARNVDAPFFAYDISRAKRLLGYKPVWDLEDGITDMIKEMKL